MSEPVSRSQYRRIEAQGGNALELAMIRIAALESSLRDRDERVKALEGALEVAADWFAYLREAMNPEGGYLDWRGVEDYYDYNGDCERECRTTLAALSPAPAAKEVHGG